MYGMSLIERYLYSLPEYRLELQQRHFIEIYSYNGLLTTRKVIEFDGNTVLCRVCGDKASGFHYGVHACEGCKGFFRRSIQQKIQYRPCLKNQQCSIMRVNRNRCQYCRLKKCIAVGMSRDAVRFGRVPKREKAKIIEQMQKVNAQSQVSVLNTVLENEGDVIQKILEAHFRLCDFTRAKFRSFFEKAWSDPKFVNCPAYKACPLNPSPCEPQDGLDKWEEFSDCFTPAIRNVVNFAKCIPGFGVFSQEDQVTLLKAGTFEVLLVHLAPLFDARTNTMLFANGTLYKRISLTVTNSAGFLLDSMFDFAERLNEIKLKDEEIGLFSALVIIASDRPGLRYADQVGRLQAMITQGLQTLIKLNHPDDPSVFSKLLMKIPDLRTLNTLHSEKLLGLTVPPSESPKDEMMPSHEDARLEEKPQTQPFPGGLGYPDYHHHPHAPPGGLLPYPPMTNIKSEGTPIVPHQVAMETKGKEVILQTPLGTFHRNPPPLEALDSMKEAHGHLGKNGLLRGELSKKCPERVPNGYHPLPGHFMTQNGDKGHCSSPEPLELDILDQPVAATVSQGNKQMPRLSPIASSPKDQGHGGPPPKVITEMMPGRKRMGESLEMERDPKLARLWEYDMRSQRSDSLSSSSSLESVDSAYRTISNPGTPRNGMEPRSPFPMLPGDAASSQGRSPHLNMPTLKGVLSTPPLNARLLGRNTDSVGSVDSTSSSPDPHKLHKKFRMKQSLSGSSTPETAVGKLPGTCPVMHSRHGNNGLMPSYPFSSKDSDRAGLFAIQEEGRSRLGEKNPAILSSLMEGSHPNSHHHRRSASPAHKLSVQHNGETHTEHSSSAKLTLKDKILKRIDSQENLTADHSPTLSSNKDLSSLVASKNGLSGLEGFPPPGVPTLPTPPHPSYFPLPFAPAMHPALLYNHYAALQQHMLLTQQHQRQLAAAERSPTAIGMKESLKDNSSSSSGQSRHSSTESRPNSLPSQQGPMNLSPTVKQSTSPSQVAIKAEPL